MYLRRFLFTLFAALIATASFGPASFAQSTAKMFTLKAANQCASVSVASYPTVGIQVTGTFSATLQPEVSIAGQSPQNTPPNFGGTYAFSSCVFSPVNDFAAAYAGAQIANGSANFTLIAGSPALTGGTLYQWAYVCSH